MAKTKRKESEEIVRNSLNLSLQGQIEVATPVGYIDILTENLVIEVKRWRDWKAGLGQVIAYGFFYPQRERRLHLFGNPPKEKRWDIERICLASHVSVSYHKETPRKTTKRRKLTKLKLTQGMILEVPF